jgi:1,2-diacylglycerol 3-alpha-glucosyltransferase
LRRFSPDVLNTHDPLQWAISGLDFFHNEAVPGVLTIHALPWLFISYMPELSQVKRAIEVNLWKYARWLVKQYDALVTPTQTISWLVTLATGVNPIVISSGVDLCIFSPNGLGAQEELALRTKFDIPPRVPIILHIGRLDKDKKIETVIMAAARAMQQCDGHLLVVGNGTEKQKLQELSQNLGIQARSHFPGFIAATDGLPDIYRLATVFVTASEIETQGIVLLEAAACGLPIVAVDAAAIPEIVKNGVNGLLSPPGDIDKLANNILCLLKNSNRARIMGEANRIEAQKHSFEHTLEAYESLYYSLLESKEENKAVV